MKSRIPPQRLSPERYNAAMTAEPREPQTSFSFSLISQTGVKAFCAIKTDLSAPPPPPPPPAPAKTERGTMKGKDPACFQGGRVELKSMIHQFGP